MNHTAAKIRMLRDSLRCFVFGLLGLLPVIGLPFALAALWLSGRVRLAEKTFWNAARPYRVWGIVLAACGTVFWIVVAAFIIYNAVSNRSGCGGIYSMSGDE